jgi:hypothetical protein
MKLTKEQYIELSRIFHARFDAWVPCDKFRKEEPAVTFSTFIEIIEEFLSDQPTEKK